MIQLIPLHYRAHGKRCRVLLYIYIILIYIIYIYIFIGYVHDAGCILVYLMPQCQASPKAAELASFAPPITEKQQLPLLPSWNAQCGRGVLRELSVEMKKHGIII